MIVWISWKGRLPSSIGFARRVDSLLVGQHPFVSRGQFSPIPKIDILPSEMKTTMRAPVVISPKYEGLGESPPPPIIIAHGIRDIVISAEGQMRFKAPKEEGNYWYTVITVTDECVIVKRRFKIVVGE